MSGELIIYGAAYGPEDVSGKVRALRQGNSLSFTANNDTFGDSWKGEKKSFVLVYKYDYPQCSVETTIVQENQKVTITPPKDLTPQRKDRLTTTSLDKIGVITSREFPPLKLTILGAAYGLENVTGKAQSLVTPQGEFNQKASNDVWGDGWKGQKKTLVSVYTYDEVYMVNVVIEGETMQFVVSPGLTIMGGAYGLMDVTAKAFELVKYRSFNVMADNEVFGDGWKGEKKTLVIVYQYGEQDPMVGFVKEGSLMYWIYSPRPRYLGSTDPTTLTILGAAYGPKDVTSTVQEHVKDNSLSITANNDTFGDSWNGQKKSLVVVYRFGRNLSQTKVVEENAQLTINQTIFRSYAGIISTNDLLDDGEIFLLSGLNNKYIECGQNGNLVAASDSTHLGLQFKVHKDAKDGAMTLEANDGKYVVVGEDRCLYVNGNADNATKFDVSISFAGGIRLSVLGGLYVRIDPFNNALKAESVDNFGASSAFEISIIRNDTGEEDEELAMAKLSDCDIAWASFIWQLTGGFFLAIGLGPFIKTGKVKTGVLALIKSNSRAWAAVQKLVNTVVTGAKNNVKLVVSGSLGVISVFYHEGLLWSIFKMMLKFGAWYALGWALAKIIEIVFIPEAEAAELLASFIIWGIQLVQASLDIGQSCN